MPKFKVGDRVKVTSKPYCQRAVVGVEYIINKIHRYVGPNRGQLYGVEAVHEINLYDCEIELVAPPLFRKGDKVLIEYEVLTDEPQRSPYADRHVKVTAPGVRAGDGVTRLAEFLAAGTITRAPEPPYVPKPGDKFHFYASRAATHPSVTCVMVDAKGLLSETRAGRRFWTDHSTAYEYTRHIQALTPRLIGTPYILNSERSV